jgi:hypothetical protein
VLARTRSLRSPGNVSLEEVARYTKAAEQKKLARAAIGRLNVGDDVGGIPNLPERFGKTAEKVNEIKGVFGFWRPAGESNPQVLDTVCICRPSIRTSVRYRWLRAPDLNLPEGPTPISQCRFQKASSASCLMPCKRARNSRLREMAWAV